VWRHLRRCRIINIASKSTLALNLKFQTMPTERDLARPGNGELHRVREVTHDIRTRRELAPFGYENASQMVVHSALWKGSLKTMDLTDLPFGHLHVC
jgi:hypothetical protein